METSIEKSTSLLRSCSFNMMSGNEFPISDEHLATGYDLLYGADYKPYLSQRQKAGAMRSVIIGNVQACQPFENYIKCIHYLEEHSKD